MTLGEKIKTARLENGLTQEELAQKLMVSRQAVTKWEADKGMPDVGNLKLLSQALNVTVDYLLDEGGTVDQNVIRERIDMAKYGKSIIPKTRTDRVMKDKFPASRIYSLLPKKKMDKADKAVDWFIFLTTPFVGVVEFLNSLKLVGTEYYLVESEGRQYFVSLNYKQGYMERRRTAQDYATATGSKFTVGDVVYTVCKTMK